MIGLRISGAITSAAIGVVIYAVRGRRRGGVLLMITFLLASLFSRLGLERKTLLKHCRGARRTPRRGQRDRELRRRR